MNTIMDYLKWRGDITFFQEKLNEVDCLIFCIFTYLDLDHIITYQEQVTIHELFLRFSKANRTISSKKQAFFAQLSESKRFKDVIVTLYFNEIDELKEMQIAGMTFLLPNNTIFVGFKGTDDTLVGWKEDFNLSYKKIIPSQLKAQKYLDFILSNTLKDVYVGGHSKGGNIAVYSSLYCKNFDKIKQIYNFDGPGLLDEIVKSALYQMRKEKMITYLPKTGIIGNLLNKDMKTIIVKSKQFGLLEHDPFSWCVEQNHFLYDPALNEEAVKVNQALDTILKKLSNSQKEKIITFLYEILNSIDLKDMHKNLLTLLKKYQFDPNDLKIIKNIWPIILSLFKNLT